MVAMERPADRYRRLTAAFADVIAAVPPERWSSPSPCEDWTARDVVGHIVDTQGLFLGFIGIEPEPRPDVGADPLAAFLAATGQVQRALDDPATAKATYQGFSGESTFEDGVDGFLAPDLVVHRWDLARAIGGDEHVDPQDVAAVKANAESFPAEAMRGPGAFGPEVEPPPDADEWQRVLAFLGRQA